MGGDVTYAKFLSSGLQPSHRDRDGRRRCTKYHQADIFSPITSQCSTIRQRQTGERSDHSIFRSSTARHMVKAFPGTQEPWCRFRVARRTRSQLAGSDQDQVFKKI